MDDATQETFSSLSSLQIDNIPGVNKFTDLFGTAYDFVESAIMSNEVIPLEKGHHHKKKKHKKKKHKKKKKKKKKHHTKKKKVIKKQVKCKEGDHYHYYYIDKAGGGESEHSYEHSYGGGDSDSYESWRNIHKREASLEQAPPPKPILTTNIKVTSEYAGPANPITAPTNPETSPVGWPPTSTEAGTSSTGANLSGESFESYEYDILGFDYGSRSGEDRDESYSESDSEYYSDEAIKNDKFSASSKKNSKWAKTKTLPVTKVSL